MLVFQVYLDVAHLAAAAQVVLAHQAVEVDRPGGARVGLVVGHLRHGGQVGGQLVQHGGGGLGRGAGGHIDDDLKFALVVKRQHLQLHPAQHRQQHRQRDQAHHRQPQQAAVAPPRVFIQQWGKDALKQRREFG